MRSKAAHCALTSRKRVWGRKAKGMLIVIYICANAIARDQCNDETARAVIKRQVESVMCGVPSQYMAQLTGEAGVKEGEYARVRCIMR
jgi:hypothetical protein